MTKFIAFQVLTLGVLTLANAVETPREGGWTTINQTTLSASGTGSATGGENLLATFNLGATLRSENGIVKAREARFVFEWGSSTNRNRLLLKQTSELSIQNGVLVVSGTGAWTRRTATMPTTSEGMRGSMKPVITETTRQGTLTITVTDGASGSADMLNVSFGPPGDNAFNFNGSTTRGNVNFRSETKSKRVRSTAPIPT